MEKKDFDNYIMRRRGTIMGEIGIAQDEQLAASRKPSSPPAYTGGGEGGGFVLVALALAGAGFWLYTTYGYAAIVVYGGLSLVAGGLLWVVLKALAPVFRLLGKALAFALKWALILVGLFLATAFAYGLFAG